MIAVFSYLLVCSTRNRIGRQLRQLRNPRYIAAFVLGGGYLYLMLWGQRSAPGSALAANLRSLELLTAIFLAGAVAWAWAFGRERRVLAFSPAEVAFLFPGPVTRRGLIQFKLLRMQLVILGNTLIWTLISFGEQLGTSRWLRPISIWVLLSTLAMHRLGASFVRTSLAEHGIDGLRHRVISLLVLGAVLIALTWSAADLLPAIVTGWNQDVGAFLSAVDSAARQPVPNALLLPFRLLARPLAATSTAVWLEAIGPALVLLVLHYVWVLRSDTAFEEAALEASLKRATRLSEASGRTGTVATGAPQHVSPPLFRLAPVGWPGTAIFWKNVVGVLRTRRVGNVLLVLAVASAIVAIASFDSDGTIAEVLGTLAGTWALLLTLIGPQWVRNDLRSDLRKLDLLRTYPLSARTIVGAEAAASTFVLSALQLILLLFAYLAFLGNTSFDLDVGFDLDLGRRTVVLAAAFVALPVLNYMGLLLHNGAALLYPAWVHLGTGRSGGVEALGQNVLTMLAFAVILAGTLAPPTVLGVGVFALLEPVLGFPALLPAAMVAAAGMAAEAWLVIVWLGSVFERTDVTAAGLEVV